ncbi:raucaffricine-O-beta-D-glucosidase-like [Coffea arabica]|uniref:Raucaffricine-O-beta-D-glucosidase-like n=1 Tax=Coffea arabica TaxID=13443 RepID=A0ABM4URB6_COFAR
MAAKCNVTSDLSRADFGGDFIFGSASSAYQMEGAAEEDGLDPSIWDKFTEQRPDKVVDGSNGNVAIDQYHRYKEDVQMMKKIGLDAYRFSISWPRVLPGGRLSAGVNKEGIQYYNNLIDELLANGIKSFVTLFYWDVPQTLEDEYGCFLCRRIVDDFREFVELCFWEFSDRVKHWITVNEPWTFAYNGYTTGGHALSRGVSIAEHIKEGNTGCRCNCLFSGIPLDGNPGTEPYLVAHHSLLAHAKAVKVYREYFKIGITLVSQWWEPLNDTPPDKEAVERAADFMFGWFMSPITYGDYPKRMRDIVKSRLPKFSKEESQNLKGSFDFLGLNYYTSIYASDASGTKSELLSYVNDQQVKTQTVGLDGKTDIGPRAGSTWLYIYPLGIYKLLQYVKTHYNSPLIYITANGVDEINDGLTVSRARIDKTKIKYHQGHLACVKQAMDVDKVDVKGYLIWSLLDNFEWSEGSTARFGIIHVNFKDRNARYPKESGLWFMNFLAKSNAVNHPSPTKTIKRALENGGLVDQEKPRKKILKA